MENMEAAQHVYVVKVRTRPDPALLFPSEQRYSALTVAGLAAGHALLGAVALLLGALALSWDPPSALSGTWSGHLGAGLWLGLAALQASVCGLLAWRRWYEDRYIVWFFRSSLLAALVAAAGLVLTSAALAHLHENLLSPHPSSGHVTAWQPAPDVVQDTTEDSASQWLDLPDLNSSTISSGGVFADQDHHEEDLLAADSTRHEQVVPNLELGDGESLRWSPLPISPRTSAQIRSLVGVNVLVASLLELLWSLLGARVAWRGMRVQMDPGTPSDPAGHPESRPPPVPGLERGPADGKVDLNNEKAELTQSRTEQNSKRVPRGPGDAVKQQQRRRAPGLPELSLEHRTMDLEERVARFLDRSQGVDGRVPGTDVASS